MLLLLVLMLSVLHAELQIVVFAPQHLLLFV